MSTTPVPAGFVPLRPAWRSLLWIVPLTALWIVLIYWQTSIPASGVLTMPGINAGAYPYALTPAFVAPELALWDQSKR